MKRIMKNCRCQPEELHDKPEQGFASGSSADSPAKRDGVPVPKCRDRDPHRWSGGASCLSCQFSPLQDQTDQPNRCRSPMHWQGKIQLRR